MFDEFLMIPVSTPEKLRGELEGMKLRGTTRRPASCSS
jgi:hypothetical protein